MRNIWVPFVVSLLVVIVVFITNNALETTFINTLNNILYHKQQYAWLSFLVLASDILLPVPSSIVMFMNGFVLGPIPGSVLSLGSLLSGSVIGYLLGKFSSMGLKAKNESQAHLFLEKYGALAILMSRGIPILSESVCIVCGYNKMPFKQYLVYNLIGYFPLCQLFALCGSVGYNKKVFLLSLGFSLVISAAFWFLLKRTIVIISKGIR